MIKLDFFLGIVAYYIIDDLITYYYKKNNNYEKSNIEYYNINELIHSFMFFSYFIFLIISLYKQYKNPHILFISFVFLKYSTIFYFYQELKKEHYGSPLSDDEDVPEELRSYNSEGYSPENEWDIDENVHKRWDWILDEIIWTFENILDDDWENLCYTDGDFDRVKF